MAMSYMERNLNCSVLLLSTNWYYCNYYFCKRSQISKQNNEFLNAFNNIICTNISFPVLSLVFNALVLFCIRDIDAAMQRMLNLKPNKDENKYEEDVPSPDLKILLNVSVYSVNEFNPHALFPRLVLPSSSPKWQKNHIDIKMYLSGVVQVCSDM